MDRLQAMTAFVSVAELRGFAPAARQLHLSPSAITRLVAGLEEHLGSRLLYRTTRAVALTDEGARFLDSARQILRAVDEAEAAARAAHAEPRGRFVVTAPNVFGRLEVAPLFSDYLARYGEVSGELILADRLVNLVDEGIDVAVRIGHLADSTLHARVVGSTRRVLVASPSYLDARRAPRSPEDLRRHDLIQLTALSPTPEWRFLRDDVEERVPIAPRLATNSADAAITHAERGGGIAMLLAYQVAAQVRRGRLRVVLPGFEPPPLPIQLVYPSARLMSANLRAFLELTTTTRSWSFVDLEPSAKRRPAR